MQFKVPQDVLRPDKIVGFLTLRQLIICTIGGTFCYVLYTVLAKQYFVEIWMPPVLFIGLITMAFAFVKFHEIVFEKLVLLIIQFKFLPRNRTWQKMRGDTVLSVLAAPKNQMKKTDARHELTEEERRKKLKEVSKLVDTAGKYQKLKS